MEDMAMTLRLLGHGDLTFDAVGDMFPALRGLGAVRAAAKDTVPEKEGAMAEEEVASAQLDTQQAGDDVMIGNIMEGYEQQVHAGDGGLSL